MARKQLGTAPAVGMDTATKGYADTQVATIANAKGQANGFAGLDSEALVPLAQLPPGVVIDDVGMVGDAVQFYSGVTAIGDPVALVLSVLDGGTPASSTTSGQTAYIDGGTP